MVCICSNGLLLLLILFSMEEIRPLTETSFDALYAAHEDAFRDYERTWSRDEYERMLRRRGYVPALSFGAFDGNKLVSFTLNGTGTFNGLKTAYDTGTGTIPGYRGKGLASRIFNESLPYLKQAGRRQYLLEVLQHNKSAINIYINAGFKVTRELNYFVRDKNEVRFNSKIFPKGIYLQKTKISVKQMMALWDFVPSWQNSFDAIKRKPGDFVCIGAYDGDVLVGYGIIEPASGDVPQLAVGEQYRRKGIASVLLKELLKYNESGVVRIINADAAYAPMTAFFVANGLPLSGKQFEMARSL
jgi:ribosomal protein S18 acetylase RimI-like enzyme